MPGRPRTPPTQRIANDLRKRLLAGEWARDEQVDSMTVLSAHYGASRATILKALHVLADEGLISIVPQYGVFSNVGPMPKSRDEKK